MGANETKVLGMFQDGLNMFQDIQKKVGGMSSQNDSEEDRARLIETDAKGRATEAQRQARKDAGELREERERLRSRRSTIGGGSNLAMSGSRKLVRDADRISDMQDEEDALFEGQSRSDSILRDGRNRANMLRINSGGSSERSILTMGSKIYGTRR